MDLVNYISIEKNTIKIFLSTDSSVILIGNDAERFKEYLEKVSYFL